MKTSNEIYTFLPHHLKHTGHSLYKVLIELGEKMTCDQNSSFKKTIKRHGAELKWIFVAISFSFRCKYNTKMPIFNLSVGARCLSLVGPNVAQFEVYFSSDYL